jgi:hypothetical protein
MSKLILLMFVFLSVISPGVALWSINIGQSPNQGHAPNLLSRAGKAKPCRTSGGRAALKIGGRAALKIGGRAALKIGGRAAVKSAAEPR